MVRHREDFSRIAEGSRGIANGAADTTVGRSIVVLHPTTPERQSVKKRPGQQVQPGCVEPFGQKVDADMPVLADVGPDIEVTMRAERFEQLSHEPSAIARSHVRECESDETDKGTAVVEVELEGNLALKRVGIDFKMEEDHPGPVAQPERLARECKQFATGLLGPGAPGRKLLYTRITNDARDRGWHLPAG